MVVFLFLQGFLCNLVRKLPQNVEKIARLPGGGKQCRILSRLWLSWFIWFRHRAICGFLEEPVFHGSVTVVQDSRSRRGCHHQCRTPPPHTPQDLLNVDFLSISISYENVLGWQFCRMKLPRKIFVSYKFLPTICSTAPNFSPIILILYVVGPEKSLKITAEIPAKFPCKKKKKNSPTCFRGRM